VDPFNEQVFLVDMNMITGLVTEIMMLFNVTFVLMSLMAIFELWWRRLGNAYG